MSKSVKGMIMRDYKSRIAGGTEKYPDAAVISIRGMKAVDTTKLRTNLRKKSIKITVVQNALARKTFEGSNLSALNDLLKGASALAYGGNSVVEVARELVEMVKGMPLLELKGAVLDGIVFTGKKGVEELAKYPTREEGIAQAVTLIVSPGKKLASQIKGPGSNIAGLIKAIETKLEKGEPVAKAS